jgi:hypothetical protein
MNVGVFLFADLVGGQDEEWVNNRIIKQYHYNISLALRLSLSPSQPRWILIVS